MLSRQEKKAQKNKAITMQSYGISLGEITPGHSSGRVFSCLVRGVLIFLAVTGTLLSTVTPFNLPCNYALVIPVLLFMSMVAAFLYYNRVTFYVGYILLFVLIAFMAFSMYYYINSGFQAFSNEVAAAYSDYFGLASYSESQEYISNRYVAVTTTMICVGSIFCIFLNIAISGFMNLIITVLLTLPLLQIPLYIGKVPSPIFSAMLLSVYITVSILQRSKHFRIPPYTQKKRTFLHVRKKKKNMTYHSYLSSGYGLLSTAGLSIIFSALFLFVTNSLFYTDLGSKTESNVVKNATDDFLKIFSQTGISGFLNRYNATGGLANGRLGGVSSVRPDYQYDLSITFVPSSFDTVYLKSYVGDTYVYDEFASTLPSVYDEINAPAKDSLAWMSITTLDKNVTETFFPYNPRFSFVQKYGQSKASRGYAFEGNWSLEDAEATDYLHEQLSDLPLADSLAALLAELNPSEDASIALTLYTPYSDVDALTDNPSITQDYETYVYENYLQIPENLQESLQNIAAEIGLPRHKRQYNNASIGRIDALHTAELLDDYFIDNFEYTMSPGVTPRNKDVVEYFLTEQKRGYCMHYAASSAMLLRSVGIPTRYVEGYVIKLSDLEDGAALSDAYDLWYYGQNRLQDTGLVNVRITDGNAHAWIEIYLDGYGWVPYEFTPPSSGDEFSFSGFSFFSMLGGLFNTTDKAMDSIADNVTGPAGNRTNFSGLRFFRSMSFLLVPLGWILLVAVILCVVLLNLDMLRNTICRISALKKGAYAQALLYSFRNVKIRLIRRKYVQSTSSIRDILDTMKKHTSYPLTEENEHYLYTTLLSAFYSNVQISSDDYQLACDLLSKLLSSRHNHSKKSAYT